MNSYQQIEFTSSIEKKDLTNKALCNQHKQVCLLRLQFQVIEIFSYQKYKCSAFSQMSIQFIEFSSRRLPKANARCHPHQPVWEISSSVFEANVDITSFQTLKWPETKWYTREDTIFWHGFPYPFTWCVLFCCEC